METVMSVMLFGPAHFLMFHFEYDVIYDKSESSDGKTEQQTFYIKTGFSGKVE